jgi:adenine-specific DNA-methyltransferase
MPLAGSGVQPSAPHATDEPNAVLAQVRTFARMRTTQLDDQGAQVIKDIVEWARESEYVYLNSSHVPGASAVELQSLSALGAVAAVAEHSELWPTEIRQWSDGAPDLPADLRTQLQRDDLHEVLAFAYEALVSGPNRRALGTFFTPTPIVRHMLALCDKHSATPTTVIDPGAGVGAFSQAALARWPDCNVEAVDINVVTLGLMSACVSADQRARLHLHLENFLSWYPQSDDLAGPRLLLGNPPYTRHQHLSALDKATARDSAAELVASGLAGLATYFIAVGLKNLQADDTLCLLLPGNWCQARYGREVRQHLWGLTNRQVRIQLFPAASEVFPGTQVTAMVLFVGPERKGSQRFVVDEIDLDAMGHVVTSRSVDKVRSMPCPERFEARQAVVRTASAILSDIATVRRGVATGANKFFFLTDEIKTSMPADVVVPALLKPADLVRQTLTEAAHKRIGDAGGRRWLLAIPDTYQPTGYLAEYLANGIEDGHHEGFLVRQRKTWYSVEQVAPPHIFITPFARTEHRVILNQINAVGSNNLYGIKLKRRSRWTASKLAQWLRGEDAQSLLAEVSRAYQGTSRKIEPGDLRTLRIPGAPPAT